MIVVAREMGHKPSTCLDIYGRIFEEFDPADRRPAVDVIRDARGAVAAGVVPAEYLRDGASGEASSTRGGEGGP